MNRLAGLLSTLSLSLLFASTPGATAPCDEKCLQSTLDQYMAALTRRDASALPLTQDVRFTENGAVGTPGKDGLWKGASEVGAYRHTFTDPTTQQVMFWGVLDQSGTPALATIRLGVENGRIAQIEHVVARKGSHALFAPEALTSPHTSLNSRVSQPLARERLIAIADSYFEGIEQHNSRIILSSEDCQRIENGVQTTNMPGRTSKNCAHSADLLTYIKAVDDRRYPIVDPARGIVVSTILFDIPGDSSSSGDAAISGDPRVAARLREPRTLLLTEWFKIDNEKIQHIEAIMHNLPQGSKSGWEK
jgi:hypothetical protein